MSLCIEAINTWHYARVPEDLWEGYTCDARGLHQTDPPTRIAPIIASAVPILRILHCADTCALEALVGFSVAVVVLVGFAIEVGINCEVTVVTVKMSVEVGLVVEVVVDTASSD